MSRTLLITTFGFALLWFNTLFAQVPQGMSYQSVIRNSSGAPQISTPVAVRFSILQGSATGTSVYVENQNFTTTAQGIVTGTIGIGTPTQGTFSTIDWSSGSYFLKVEADINNQGAYSLSGTSPIVSVPYSLYSVKAGSLAATGGASGNVLTWDGANADPNVALFEVKDKKGNPIFSVYPTGVEIVFDETAPQRGSKGGFAVSGRNSTRAVVDIMRMTADSTTVYVNNLAKRGSKGGFAVSGRNSTRVIGSDILRVTPDSTRIYTTDPTKGFGVGQTGAGTVDNYLKLLPDNYFIGHQSGVKTTGKYNTFFGYTAGLSNTTGTSNIFVGYEAGKTNTEGLNNVFIGNECGKTNTTGQANAFVGRQSGYSNTTGAFNVFIGDLSGFANTSGENNTFIGQGAGNSNTTGTNNIFMGCDAGRKSEATVGNIFLGRNTGYSLNEGWGNTFIGHLAAVNLYIGAENLILGSKAGGEKDLGNRNVLLGAKAGQNNYAGDENIFIGSSAGINAAGSSNVFIGSNAGSNEALSNKLYIANTDTDTLIYGDFASKQLVINGSSLNLSRGYTFWVNGTAGGSNSWFSTSDLRLKKNIQTIPNALDKVLKLRGVNFEWKDETRPGLNVGFIAQEVLPVIPEVVKGSEQTSFTMDYASLTAVIVEAVKDQQQQIDRINKENSKVEALIVENEEQKVSIAELKSRIAQLEVMIKTISTK